MHTPTPWTLGERMKNGNLESIGIRAGRFIIGETFGLNSETEEQKEANAQFIVTAVNAHEELVKACQAVSVNFEDAADWKDAIGRLQKGCREALAKAGVKL